MANTIQKPDQEDLNPAKDVGQTDFEEIIDKNFSPEEKKAMEERARVGADSDLAGRDEQAADDVPAQDSTVKQRESQGDTAWKNNTTPEKPKPSGNAFFKKGKGIFVTLAVCVAIAGGIFSFISHTLGLVSLKETMVQNISERANDIMERREARVLAKKLSGDMTKGCGVVKIKCRYRGFTDREADKFNRRAFKENLGVRLIDDPTCGAGINPLKKCKKMVTFDMADLPDGSGSKDLPKKYKEISSADLRREMIRNPAIRKATSSFYRGTVEYGAGRAGKAVIARAKLFPGKRVSLAEEDNKERMREVVRKLSPAEGEVNAQTVNTEAREGETDSERAEREDADNTSTTINDDVKDAIQNESDQLQEIKKDPTKSAADPEVGSTEYNNKYKNSVNKIINKGKGVACTVGACNPFSAIQNICMIRMLVGAVQESRSVLQAVQLMRYSMMFVSLADRIKAGDADGDTTQQINDLMTTFGSKDSEGFSGFDSFGYNWASTRSLRRAGNENVGKYQNGGPPPGIMGSAVGVAVDTKPLPTLCPVAFSTTATVIGLGITAGGVVAGFFTAGAGTAAVQAAKTGGATAAKLAVEKVVKENVETLVEKETRKDILKRYFKQLGVGVAEGAAMEALFRIGIPPLISSIASATTGMSVTGDEQGRDVGNATVSGFGVMNSQLSKGHGLQPINANEAASQDKLAYENQLKIAKQEGVNQLDASNQYSFANKFAVSLMPSISSFGSISSIPSGISKLAFAGINGTANSAYADVDPTAQYKYCIDSKLEAADVAGDPFCNPQYGFDSAIIDGSAYDPEAVAEYLYTNNWIDDSGEPVDEFETFIKECMQTNSPIGDSENCTKGVKIADAPSGGSSLTDSLFTTANAAGSSAPDPEDVKYTAMRLYCIDSSVENDMNDGEGPGCPPEVQNTGEVESSTGELPSGTAQELAKQLLDSGNITGSSEYIAQIQDVADGKGGCNVDEAVLSSLLLLAQNGMKISISSLNRKCTGVLTASGTASYHYADGGGHAVDIQAVDDVALTGRDPKSVEIIKMLAPLLPSGSGFGQSTCSGKKVKLPSGISEFSDSCNHLHIQIKYN